MAPYPTLEKSAQNRGVCENQGKQRKLSDHWKSIKTLSLHPAKSDKSIQEKESKTAKRINYWEITASTWSN